MQFLEIDINLFVDAIDRKILKNVSDLKVLFSLKCLLDIEFLLEDLRTEIRSTLVILKFIQHLFDHHLLTDNVRLVCDLPLYLLKLEKPECLYLQALVLVRNGHLCH